MITARMEDQYNKVLAERNELREQLAYSDKAIREIYEVWAGSEGLVETTASEAYQTMLIEQMRDIASEYLEGDE